MHLDVIETFEALQEVRAAWNEVYEADPEANIFMSHQWLDDWLKFCPGVWFILAVKQTKESPDYLAFLPLRIRPRFDEKAGLYSELFMAGNYFSEYTGILCRPEAEKEAIPALANHVRRELDWDEFKLENLMMSERRRRLFLKPFGTRRFVQKPISYVQNRTQIDNGVCPMADLPESWDDYLGLLSANNRQKIRRLLKKVDGSDQYRISIVEGEEQFRIIDILLDQWRTKWLSVKGEKRAASIIELNRGMLQRCARNGTLFLPVFWDGDRPVAILATLVDRSKRSLHFLITGRDESFTELPSGYLLHAFSIRHAIAQGFRTYDFLRGNEPYKYHFATREVQMNPCTLHTDDRRNRRGEFDPRCLDEAIRLAKGLEDEGKGADAEMAYRQIVAASPDHALTLYRLGRLLARRGEHGQAVPWLQRSVEAEPAGDNAWKWLARSLQATAQVKPALEAWGKVARFQPDNEEAEQAMTELRMALLRSQRPDLALPSAAPSALVPAFAAAQPGKTLPTTEQLRIFV